jgi:hypothetical protein
VDEGKFDHLFVGARETLREVLSRFTPEERDVLERYNQVLIETFRRRVIEA